MAAAATGEKDKMTITVCDVDKNGKLSLDKSKTFKFMLNPSEYDHSYEIEYDKKEALGQSASETRFNATKPEKLKFTTLIDGSGAIAGPDAASDDVKTQLQNLKTIVYDYDGSNHEPNVVQVLWGSQIFHGRLETMTVDNTLFKPNGEPLRCKLTLAFASYVSSEEEAARANRSSPDMSHLIEVTAGDTLPLLCYRVYRDSSYYPDVARINGITDFRDLEPGSKLHFPPLR